MGAFALSLPSVSAEEAVARQRLGAGVELPFDVAGAAGLLTLSLGNGPTVATPAAFECAHGAFALGEPGPVLSLFGECPVALPTEAGPDDEWFWSLFHQVLSEPLRRAFGFLKPLAAVGVSGIACRLEVRLGVACVVSHLEMPGQTLLGLLDAAPWQRRAAPWTEHFVFRVPLLVGHLALATGQLAALRPGDVVVPETHLFDSSGQGLVRLGRHCLQVRVHSHAAPLHLTVLALEETAMSSTADTDILTPEWDDTARYAADEQATEAFDPATLAQADADADAEDAPAAVDLHQRFDDLPLALTVRCGHLNLTLGELRNLAPGAVLQVQGIAAGAGALFYGERPLAHGELVEVDGRLGLQIVRVDVAG
ncbi:FliM/FliN family flagellar motor switch protein [Pseudomonas sp. RGM2987]|uniref:FliM/FliN family flagellar motor switch protein n=1 Tax=Pseudomonas sp. RGM2987 TaxID=2930090 RepID=UPI001FD712A4|nr:FliM/FliN family flagellar motor switch protein [Pseudomonas sp. RGM2987]MCJ8205541.1 FliM/FliN family flagellar motor switch protein [Pseudomonas sp. RGM2987]